MKTSLKLGLVAASLATAWSASAQEAVEWGRVGFGYRVGLNISANFSGLGGFAPAGGNPGPGGIVTGAPGTVVRRYDDGFIGIDNSGNAGNRTTFWGYDNAGQVVGDAILMHSSSSAASVNSGDVDDGPQHGFELTYAHLLGEGEKWSWGIEGAFNWTDINIKDSRNLLGNVVRLTHSYALDGVIPPPPPYAGTASGPGALLSEIAVPLASGGGVATINGNRQIEATLYGFRLGPRIEFQLCKRLSVELGGGLSFGVIDSEFSFDETVSISGLGTRSHRGNDQSTDVLYGGYVRGQVNVNLWKNVSWFGGAELNDMGSFEQSVAGKTANLDLGTAVYVSTGIGLSF